jgi:hypothetical protein
MQRNMPPVRAFALHFLNSFVDSGLASTSSDARCGQKSIVGPLYSSGRNAIIANGCVGNNCP